MQITLAFTHRPTMVALPPQNMQTRLSIAKNSFIQRHAALSYRGIAATEKVVVQIPEIFRALTDKSPTSSHGAEEL
jgi:hypothetical protein